jgi:hypothetical protein
MRCFPWSGEVPPAGFEPAAHGLGIHRRSGSYAVPDLGCRVLAAPGPWRSSRIYPARSIALVGRKVGSVWPESEPLTFRQMAGSHHHEVSSVERGHLAKVEAFGQGDDARVDGLEAERGVGGQ